MLFASGSESPCIWMTQLELHQAQGEKDLEKDRLEIEKTGEGQRSTQLNCHSHHFF